MTWLEDLLVIEDYNVNPHLLNTIPEKTAYDDKIQIQLKSFIEKEIIVKIPENNDILENIIKEIRSPILNNELPDLYKTIDKIVKRFSILAQVRNVKNKLSSSFPFYFPKENIERLQKLYIKLGRTIFYTTSQITDTFDTPNTGKEKLILDDNQKSLALYILALTLLKKEFNN